MPNPTDVPAPAPALRDRIAAALYERERPPLDPAWADAYAMDREVFETMADAVLAVLPPPADPDRATVLREAADALDADMERFFAEWPDEPHNSPYALGRKDAAAELRRLAAESQEGCTLCGHLTCMGGKPCGVISTERGELADPCGCTGAKEESRG